MSVRRTKQRDVKTGAMYEFWMVDVKFRHPDGRIERVRKVSPVQTKRGAEQYERQLRQALLDGTHGKKQEVQTQAPTVTAPAVVPTIAEFADKFLNVYAKTNNKASEVESKRSVLKNHIDPSFGKLRLDQVGKLAIEEYKARKIDEDNPHRLHRKTVNNHLTILHKMLTTAAEWEIIPPSSVPSVKWLRPPKPKFDFLTFEEAPRLVDGADGEWRCMIAVAWKTGLRMGELRALRWEDVDLVAGRLTVRQAVARNVVGTPKNGKEREIPLSPETVRCLKAHRHLRGELVFCDQGGAMLTKEECKWPLWRACKRSGLRRIGWHVLRHTFASHLVMKGAPLKAVQELMGHSTIEMTMRYAHLSPDARSNAVNLLDQATGLRDKVGAKSGDALPQEDVTP